jgi:hypothetical protein
MGRHLESSTRRVSEDFRIFIWECCESKWLIAKPKIELWDAPHNTMIENNENMYPQQQAPISLCTLLSEN